MSESFYFENVLLLQAKPFCLFLVWMRTSVNQVVEVEDMTGSTTTTDLWLDPLEEEEVDFTILA